MQKLVLSLLTFSIKSSCKCVFVCALNKPVLHTISVLTSRSLKNCPQILWFVNTIAECLFVLLDSTLTEVYLEGKKHFEAWPKQGLSISSTETNQNYSYTQKHTSALKK